MGFSLIDAVYSTALDDDSWDGVLQGVRRLAGVRLVSLLETDSAAVVRAFTGVGDDRGWLAGCLADYGSDYRDHDPAGAVVADWPVGRWFDDTRHLAPRQRDRGIFHQEFLKPRDLGCWQGLWVHREGPGNAFMALIGAPDAAPIAAGLRSQIDEVGVHLGRALRMRARLDAQAHRRSLAESTLDAVAAPMFLLDENRNLVLSNVHARELIRRFPRQLRFAGGRFMPEGCSEPAQWQATCARGQIELRCGPAPAATLRFHLAPVPPNAELARTWQCPLTLMSGNAIASDDRVSSLLRQLYGLTPAEAGVCLSLCRSGLSPKQCAELRGVTMATIRTQIATIHAKVGVRRSQDLLRVVAGLCDRLTTL